MQKIQMNNYLSNATQILKSDKATKVNSDTRLTILRPQIKENLETRKKNSQLRRLISTDHLISTDQLILNNLLNSNKSTDFNVLICVLD